MTSIRLPLEESLLAAIDEKRGDVPRVRWIRRVLEERVAVQKGGVRVPEPKPSKQPPVRGNSSSRPVTDLAPPPQGPAPGARVECDHPKAKQRVINGGAVICDDCGSVRR